MLQDAGAKVALAENGKQGLDESLRRPFDAILLDMQMPIMDGYTAAAAMREAGVNCPIIALTAHAMSGDEEKARAAGCDDYLSKPIDEDLLYAKLRTFLGDSSSK